MLRRGVRPAWRLAARGAAASAACWTITTAPGMQVSHAAWFGGGKKTLTTAPGVDAATPSLSAGAKAKLAALDIVIYQYAICPFCNKIKALLDLYGVPYSVVEVNPLTKAQLKHVPDYRKVPVACIGGEIVTDSARIVEALRARMEEASGSESSAFFSAEAQTWADFADKEMAVLLFPNITRTWGESYQAFSYVNDIPTFSTVDKMSNLAIGSTAMWLAQGKLKKKYNIDDERAALLGAVRKFEEAIEGQPFLGGGAPNMGDVAVFGVLRAIKGMDAYNEIQDETQIGPWYRQMETVVGTSACTGFR